MNGFSNIEENETSLILGQKGQKDAKITITVFLSLYCGHCSSAFLQLKDLVEEFSNIKINTIFSIYNDESYKKMINVIYYLYRNKGYKEVLVVLDKWYSSKQRDVDTLLEDIKMPDDFDVITQIQKENENLFTQNEIYGTPTVFVNGYKYPIQEYDYSDIKYYFKQIEDQTMESKRQEVDAFQN